MKWGVENGVVVVVVVVVVGVGVGVVGWLVVLGPKCKLVVAIPHRWLVFKHHVFSPPVHLSP